jgi:endonuclease-8
MPEGDTLHRAAAALQVLVGERVEAESPHPRGLATGIAAAVDGRTLERVEAVGKNLLLHFDHGVTVHSHLRMSGRWRVRPRDEPRRGRPWLVLRGGAWQAEQWNGPVLVLARSPRLRVGPDVVAEDVDPELLLRAVRAHDPGRPVADLLLDQRVVSGIGTVWLAEMLWAAGLSPWLPAGDVPDAQLRDALTWCAATMRRSVRGERPARRVYGRAGRPCPRCSAEIASGRVGDANRVVTWCPQCQPGRVAPRPAGGVGSSVA